MNNNRLLVQAGRRLKAKFHASLIDARITMSVSCIESERWSVQGPQSTNFEIVSEINWPLTVSKN